MSDMKATKRKRLEAAGWKSGSADEFLELRPEESALLDVKASIGTLVRSTRQHARLSQKALAARLRSSQSRVAKLESGEASVSLDLLFKAALAAGVKKADLAKAIVRKRRAASA